MSHKLTPGLTRVQYVFRNTSPLAYLTLASYRNYALASVSIQTVALRPCLQLEYIVDNVNWWQNMRKQELQTETEIITANTMNIYPAFVIAN